MVRAIVPKAIKASMITDITIPVIADFDKEEWWENLWEVDGRDVVVAWRASEVLVPVVLRDEELCENEGVSVLD